MLLKIRNTESVSRKELEMILTTEDEAFVQELYRQARETAREYYGNQIYILSLSEFSDNFFDKKGTFLQDGVSCNVSHLLFHV